MVSSANMRGMYGFPASVVEYGSHFCRFEFAAWNDFSHSDIVIVSKSARKDRCSPKASPL